MKPKLLHRNPKDYLESVAFQCQKSAHFLPIWHYHVELELVYIEEGTGSFFVGDSIESFSPGTLVLLGSNLAHKWLNDSRYFHADSTLEASSLTIHFAPDFLKVNLKQVPELYRLGVLIDNARLGIIYQGEEIALVRDLLVAMKTQSAYQRLIGFFEILRLLAEEIPCRYLASPGYFKMFKETSDRFGKVHAYIMNHFQQDISLEQIAEVAHMNKSAFCRYFKKTTKKSFSNYLHEIRIGYACKLLNEQEDIAISEVCFECGYNNVSNFNRQFRLVTGFSPTDYLRQHLLN